MKAQTAQRLDQGAALLTTFVDDLQDIGFAGEVLSGYADRLVNATDNSIYQVMPQLVLAPRSPDDIDLIFQVANTKAYRQLQFTARGGGTGTNAQALNSTIIIDTSRFLRDIVKLDKKNKLVKVEPGVVLDDLNAYLEPHGLYFPPHVSPSNRATLGGMVSTDASGKGSRIYGKTSDYLSGFTAVLHDGKVVTETDDGDTGLYAELADVIATEYDAVTKNLPKLPRGISGYNISESYDNETKSFNLSRLIAGSEGTLCVLKDLTLNVIALPKHKAVYAVSYDSFDGALRDVESLLEFDPSMIETIDAHVLKLAREDHIWGRVRKILPQTVEASMVRAIHFVAFEASSAKRLKAECEIFEAFLKSHGKDTRSYLGHYKASRADEVLSIWRLRSKCVGLLGNMNGERKPVSFVEDMAVPPENMADFVAEFRSYLEGVGLSCGVFGHADVGCLHIRPALNLQEKGDRKMIRVITNEAVKIVQKHGGVLWGEHGKGVRGEYTAEILGAQYYSVMCEIKALLDPDNRLNPGKLASGDGGGLYKIDRQRMRGQYDSQIRTSLLDTFPKATACNGNGQCFSTMKDDTMCPSYKITWDRKQSPKGRTALLREWLRLQTHGKATKSFTNEVFKSFAGCLGCKACTHTCPVHVNVPDMKSQFLEMYYQKKARPVRDYLIGLAERSAKYIGFYDFGFVRNFVKSNFGLVDLPRQPAYPLRIRSQHEGYKTFRSPKQLKKNSVFILQDAYTSFYDPAIVSATFNVMREMGYDPLFLPFKESGKSWHVRGFMDRFRIIAGKNTLYLNDIAAYGLPIVGMDPSMSLVYRDEYKSFAPQTHRFNVLLLHEWFAQALEHYKVTHKVKPSKKSIVLFNHCTEKSALPNVGNEWVAILKYMGADVSVANVGCCGMAGVYGHEAENYKKSKGLYQMSWEDPMKSSDIALVTGYSCRSQVKRFSSKKPIHPIQLLEKMMGVEPKP